MNWWTGVHGMLSKHLLTMVWPYYISQDYRFPWRLEVGNMYEPPWSSLTCIEIRRTNDHGGDRPPAFREEGTLELWTDIRLDIHYPIYHKCAGIHSNTTRCKRAIYFM
jgi:hypothetical protein